MAHSTPQPPVGPNTVAQYLQPQPAPVFPDYSSNYQQTIVIPAQEAAEQAAEAQAQQLAAQQATVAQTAPSAPTAPNVGGNCASWMAAAGITDIQTALAVINRESGCNPNAVNSSSGACGIGQQLPCGKWPHLWNDPVGSLIDTQNYVFSTYGSWGNALASEYNRGWY